MVSTIFIIHLLILFGGFKCVQKYTDEKPTYDMWNKWNILCYI